MIASKQTRVAATTAKASAGDRSSKERSEKPNYYRLIRELIVSGALVPNERLIENDLAQRFGTNRANIRIALSRLDQEGLVSCEPNHSARVRVVEKDEALQIFETRGALERLVAEHAARNATPAQCRKMRALLDTMEKALVSQDLQAFSDETAKLRAVIWIASRHETATRLLSAVNYQLVRFRYRSITVPGRAEQSIRQFRAIVDAIEGNRPQAAQAAMDAYSAAAIASLRSAFRRH
ncbi:GntR family transcriptional regulator [Bradyrhizobium sp. KB893862 SZCCT0404]|uniref:GntR family transcriptional regulator n=1 Tax=Bradyrhizobium sp. KB893862 SZCCT0404 TaxID=2807672 RepID=UPI001BA4FD6E|nr:GntR family transcriptional regulator [Bradyrhizobium sp. KB893862 SZCCT0404]MBR1175319.1 GntR family transcriptional regulator [Bradyrhizobium sp. KB893862 SZCCT0404]